MEKQTDTSTLLTPLREAEPGVSLDELQQFLSSASTKSSSSLGYSLAGIGALLIVAITIIFISHRTDSPVIPHRIAAVPSVQAPITLSDGKSIEHSAYAVHSNHPKLRTSHIPSIAFAQATSPLIEACALCTETSANSALSPDFTKPSLLCANVTAPIIPDFEPNTLQLSNPSYEK